MDRKGISTKKRFKVFERDAFTCQYCGRSAPDVVLHIDHIVPVSKGGSNDMSNLITACRECNLGKSDIDIRLDRFEDMREIRRRVRNIGQINIIVTNIEEKWRR